MLEKGLDVEVVIDRRAVLLVVWQRDRGEIRVIQHRAETLRLVAYAGIDRHINRLIRQQKSDTRFRSGWQSKSVNAVDALKVLAGIKRAVEINSIVTFVMQADALAHRRWVREQDAAAWIAAKPRHLTLSASSTPGVKRRDAPMN